MLNRVINYFLNEDKYILFVYLFLFLTPWNLFKSQTAIFSLILIFWALIKYRGVLLDKIKIVWLFKPLFFLVSFVLFCYVSIFWSESLSEGFKRVHNFHKYELLFVPALLIALNKEQAISSIKVLLLSFTCYSIFSIFIYFDLISIVGSSTYNPKGILRFSISTQYMVIASFSAIFIAFYSKIKSKKLLFSTASLLSVFALFINYSRTSQLSFLLILFLFIIMFLINYTKSFKFYVISFLVIISVLFSFSQNERMVNKFNVSVNEVKNVYNNNVYNGSFGARLYFNKAGIKIIKDNFFFGMGPVDNRNKLVEMEKEDKHYKMRVIKHFHSEHMEILTAYGFVGYALLFFAIVLLIYKLRNVSLYYYLSLSVFLTLFFVSFANKTLALKPLNYIYVIFFVLFSIIAYQSKLEKKSLERTQ
ncbi:MAG: O-antigen ligase [Sulfurimonas sp.]|jgi:O-antigen ligase